ncbi:MAG: stage III sporulation protein AB [Firmicutes bacterium]|nr:stage III sporulation protein AB [Bacillota bacterium]
MKLLGALLIIAAGAALGISKYLVLKKRADTLSDLLSALEQMRGEISLRLTPLPELTKLLSERGNAAVRGFFARLSDELERLDEAGFSELWEAALPALTPLGGEDFAALRPLGAVLGRFDAREQETALSRAIAELGERAAQARAALPASAKLYIGLGFGVAAMLAVALV